MGWRTVADVRDYSNARGSAYTVLVMLSERAPDETRIAHPGIDLLARDSRVSRSTCQRALQQLEEMGEIEAVAFREGGRGKATEWAVLVKQPQDDTLSERVASEAERVASEAPKGRKRAVKGASADTPTKGTEVEPEGDVARATPRVMVASKFLTADEWAIAERAIAVFNGQNGSTLSLLGTRGQPTESLKRIVMRAREHPELDPDAHEAIVKRNFAHPWWSESKAGGVGVIYGPNAWQRAMVSEGRPTRPRRFKGERDSDPENDPW